jgi:diaminohydroxyphosphoribosylaminopyrimidine deaminase/5-amino-6-(5-phosphoribosylamino)uracil reductase
MCARQGAIIDEGGRSVRVEGASSGGESGRTPPIAADIFAPFFETPPERPFVVGQLGQSLDGRIATLCGESRDISGEAALDHLHRIRAHVDAVVVGAHTIVVDDPQLSVRRVAGTNPARVVIDPSGRLDSRGRWLAEDGARRIVVTGETASASCGAETIRLEARAGVIPPAAIVEALFVRGLRRILVEGGARTLSTFLEAGRLDRLHVLVAPMIIGSGRAGLDLPPITKLESALRPRVRAHFLEGGDVLFDCDLSACRWNF